jgi:hypothetical protein
MCVPSPSNRLELSETCAETRSSVVLRCAVMSIFLLVEG